MTSKFRGVKELRLVENHDSDVKIYVRILPLEIVCESCARIDKDRKTIYVRCLQDVQSNRIAASKEPPSYWAFRVDDVFCDASQEDIYRVTTSDLLEKALDGANCVLIGYGQTGSGKSFTIGGLGNHWQHRGLIARLLTDLFTAKTSRRKSNDVQYSLSFVELRGKIVVDLLAANAKNNIKINERDAFRSIIRAKIKNEEEGLKRIFRAEARRSAVRGSTYSTSHLGTALITFHVSNASLIPSWPIVASSKIHIVEMAGTGTAGKSDCSKPPADVGMANLTKAQMERFFSHLRTTGECAGTVRRSNNLLKLLGDAISPTSLIRFISHVRITKEDLRFTLSTLRFTSKIVQLRPKIVAYNIERSPESTIRELQNEVEELKKELDVNDILLNQEASTNISKARVERMKQSILDFLNGSISDLQLNSWNATNNRKNKKSRVSSQSVEETKEKREEVGVLYSFVVRERFILIGVALGTEIRDDSTTVRERVFKTADSSKNVEKVGSSEIGNASDTVNNQFYDVKRQVPSLKRLFEIFLSKNTEHAHSKEKLENEDKTLAVLNRTFADAIERCCEIKKNLENARADFAKHREIRKLMEMEDREVFQVLENERNSALNVACYEKSLANIEEEVALLRGEIHNLLHRRFEIRANLEAAFHRYCENINLQVDRTIPVLDTTKEKPSKNAQQLFYELQRKVLRGTEINLEET
ncbi:hypothetical protein KM043_006273 [Ampulex compressa]|nr:hypothetical protein KM043_006273 [Ampulex compressa]